MNCLRLSAIIFAVLGALGRDAQAAAIRQHPDNHLWFEYAGKPLALITGAEHYGAVLNRRFDYRKYLRTLQADGLNYTRVFAGTYVEPPGAFGIQRNTLAPEPGEFLAPWKRSEKPGYAGGGNKFDLESFDPTYLARLKQFIQAAGEHGIVVELTFFCSTYSDKQWAVHPLNPTNNIQAVPVKHWRELHVPGNEAVWRVQEKLVRHLVRELNSYDNLFYEIQNEPWADHHTMGEVLNPYLTDRQGFPNAVEITTDPAVSWQSAIAKVIADEEATLEQRHLIAQNVSNFRLSARPEDFAPEVSLLNFHYAFPEACTWNHWLGKIIGFDETGFAGTNIAVYRKQAWNFVMSGGGLFNHLDYSFSTGHEDGSDISNRAPGLANPELRKQLAALSRWLHNFELAEMRPDNHSVKQTPGVVTRTLSWPGRAYAIYLEGRSPAQLGLELTKATWTAQWMDPATGKILSETKFRQSQPGLKVLTSPPFEGAVALSVRKN